MKLSSISLIWTLFLSACALGPPSQPLSIALPANLSTAQKEVPTPPAGAVRADPSKSDQAMHVDAAREEGDNAPRKQTNWETNVVTSVNDHAQLAGGAPSPHPVGLPMPLFELATGSLPSQRLNYGLASPSENGLAPKAVEQARFSRRPRSHTPEESQARFLNEFQKTAAAMVLASKQEYRRFESQCACPADIHFDGTVCGERSAYSLQRPSRPLCYTSDVTPDMVAEFWRTGSIVFSIP